MRMRGYALRVKAVREYALRVKAIRGYTFRLKAVLLSDMWPPGDQALAQIARSAIFYDLDEGVSQFLQPIWFWQDAEGTVALVVRQDRVIRVS